MSNGCKNKHALKALAGHLNYNEQKVKSGKAKCLYAAYFLQAAKELNFYQKLERFKHQNSLNQSAKTNTLHIALTSTHRTN